MHEIGRGGERRSMAENKLHCFYDSGNSFKVAMMQDVAGLDWEAVPVAPHCDLCMTRIGKLTTIYPDRY